MSKFMAAMNTNDSLTENGALAHSTTGSECLDLFFAIGASRGKSGKVLINQFTRAYAANQEQAIRTLLWARDVRGGAGERETFRKLFTWLCKNNTDLATRVLVKIPELGRYDDLLAALNTPLEGQAIMLWANAIFREENQLAAKWLPRRGRAFNLMFTVLNVKPGVLRRAVAQQSNTVEQLMCAKQFDKIDYNKLPSIAAKRYQKSFNANDENRYAEYKAGLETGESKVNASAIFPHDVIRGTDVQVVDAQWKSLPNYLEGATKTVMPVIDVSGSMQTAVGGLSGGVTCMAVAISLGMYLAERAPEPFKNEYISFSGRPNFHKVNPLMSVQDRFRDVERSGEDYSTNVVGVFEKLLDRAIAADLAPEDMPDQLVIFSDMQFNQADDSWRNATLPYSAAKELFEGTKYKLPDLVFWNLRDVDGTTPVKVDDQGVCLVSGFSPAIMSSIVKGECNPADIMLSAIMSERYSY